MSRYSKDDIERVRQRVSIKTACHTTDWTKETPTAPRSQLHNEEDKILYTAPCTQTGQFDLPWVTAQVRIYFNKTCLGLVIVVLPGYTYIQTRTYTHVKPGIHEIREVQGYLSMLWCPKENISVLQTELLARTKRKDKLKLIVP
ncbi:hypothetical protein CBL_03165 [Carabus blaptoides fortunei]